LGKMAERVGFEPTSPPVRARGQQKNIPDCPLALGIREFESCGENGGEGGI
jgi:hypothetical protein